MPHRRLPLVAAVVAALLGAPLALSTPAARAAGANAAAAVTDGNGFAPQSPLLAAILEYRAGHFETAARAFTTLAQAGEPVAMHDLAVMHLRGELPDASVDQARQWLEKAARQGFVTSVLALAELHESGRLGRKDPAGALPWLQVAAEAGHVQAQIDVGSAHYLGRGTARDERQALHWYREAAKAGDIGAQYLTASMYETGLGTAVDERLARYWYDRAARQGDPVAKLKRAELDRRMKAGAEP
ncbi:tetratricopeptide repeat protein [Leptothrix sp. BB-4]